MRRALLIFLSLVLVLPGWSLTWAEDFCVVPAQKGNFAPVAKTGQTVFHATGDDGDLQKGVAWPIPRFTDNYNGTVTDNLTGLIWMKNARCSAACDWVNALNLVTVVADPYYGLTDGSEPGDWRLPNFLELRSLVDFGRTGPALPMNHPFLEVQSDYWSSTTLVNNSSEAWGVHFYYGSPAICNKQTSLLFVWCVRDAR